MYTAIQARNIADEKEHHIYYGIYRQYARDLMRAIEYAVDKEGKFGTSIMSNKNSSARDQAVLEQLGTEMAKYGYQYHVSCGDGDMRGRYMLTVSW